MPVKGGAKRIQLQWECYLPARHAPRLNPDTVFY